MRKEEAEREDYTDQCNRQGCANVSMQIEHLFRFVEYVAQSHSR